MARVGFVFAAVSVFSLVAVAAARASAACCAPSLPEAYFRWCGSEYPGATVWDNAVLAAAASSSAYSAVMLHFALRTAC